MHRRALTWPASGSAARRTACAPRVKHDEAEEWREARKIDVARARVASVDAQSAALEKELADASVLARQTGIVTESWRAGELVTRGAPWCDHGARPAWANLFVPEPMVPRVMLGQPATVFTDAGGPGLPGKVRSSRRGPSSRRATCRRRRSARDSSIDQGGGRQQGRRAEAAACRRRLVPHERPNDIGSNPNPESRSRICDPFGRLRGAVYTGVAKRYAGVTALSWRHPGCSTRRDAGTDRP